MTAAKAAQKASTRPKSRTKCGALSERVGDLVTRVNPPERGFTEQIAHPESKYPEQPRRPDLLDRISGRPENRSVIRPRTSTMTRRETIRTRPLQR
jgi:hypothetical protein